MQEPDFSMVQESLNATLAKVSAMKAQLSSIRDTLASKEREFELLRQERQETGADTIIDQAMALLRKSTDTDILEIGEAIKKLSKHMPCSQSGDNDDLDDLSPVNFTEKP